MYTYPFGSMYVDHQCSVDNIMCTSILGIRMHSACQVYASPTRPAQLCACMSINDIPDRDGQVRTYVHHENRSLIQSLTLMHSAIM